MSCHRFIGGIFCTDDSTVHTVAGVRFEMHSRLGPIRVNAAGDPAENQHLPATFWIAFTRWQARWLK